jgi:hypothetical protein
MNMSVFFFYLGYVLVSEDVPVPDLGSLKKDVKVVD